jgi:uncharacterized RDD family membrane protein YckC
VLELDGQPLELPEGEILLGRSRSCTVTLPDPSISRQHAKLLLRHGQVRLRDLNSSNGTFLNDSRVHTETDVVDGDRIVLGETEMRFRAAAPEGPGPATQPVVPAPAPAPADAEEEAPTVRGVSSDVSRARQLGPKTPDPGRITPRLSEVPAGPPRPLVSASTRPRPATVEPVPAALRPAGFWIRTLAVLIDSLWIGALVGLGIALPILLDLPASLASAMSAGAGLLSAVLVIAGWAKWGTTPGKRLLGLYVCRPGGPPGIGVGRAVLRLSIALLGIGFLLVAFNKDKRGLHDLIAGTAVGRR